MSLVTTVEVDDYAGITTAADNTLVQTLIDQVEAAFLRATNRLERPFQVAQGGRAEVRDGSGSATLFVDYPIAALTTALTLGLASPWTESLDPANPLVLAWAVGSRRIVRVDGGCFGSLDRAAWVRVTYDAQADQPLDVKLALIRAVWALYRESGKGEATGERILADAQNLPLVLDRDPYWTAAVQAHWTPRI